MRLKNVILSFALLLVYSMLTFVGIGIYHCGCTQSQQLAVWSIQTECPPCSSTVEKCCPHGEPHHFELNSCGEDECCLLAYQYASVDQLYVTQPNNDQAKVLSLFFLPFVVLIAGVRRESIFCKRIHSPPPNFATTPIIYLHRQLRL